MEAQDLPAMKSEDPTDQMKEESLEKREETTPSDQDASTKAASAGEEAYDYATGPKLVVVIVTVTMVAFLLLLDSSIIVTAIPHITSQFHSIPDIGWYASAYLLGNCSFQPLSGKLYTHFSSKYTFLGFFAIFEFGSVLCGAAVSSKMLIVGRAVAGLGGSGLTNGAMTIISACVPLEKRPALLGFMISFAQLGILFGPLVGGALTQYSTWRWCFYINLPAGAVVAAIILAIHIPEGIVKEGRKSTVKQSLQKLDLLGAALFAATIVIFLLALEWGGTTYSWSSGTVIGLFVGSAAMLVLFGFWEHRRGSTAMIPLAMLRKRVVYSSCVTLLLNFGNAIVTTYYIPLWLQVVHGASPTLSGVYLLPMIVSQMVFSIGSGVAVGKLGRYMPFVLLGGVLQSIAAGLFTTFTPTTGIAYWSGTQVLAGSGRGAGLQMPIVAVQNALPAAEAAIGISLIVFCQYFGGALAGAFGQTIFLNTLVAKLHQFAPKVSADAVISAGATSVRAVVPKAFLPGVLLAYNVAVTHTFYLATGACVAMVFTCLGMGWKSIKKEKPKAAPAEA